MCVTGFAQASEESGFAATYVKNSAIGGYGVIALHQFHAGVIDVLLIFFYKRCVTSPSFFDAIG
jgi:hypothetical protein